MIRCLHNAKLMECRCSGLIRLLFLSQILIIATVCYCYADKYGHSNPDLTLAVNCQPTKKVLRQISRLSGYTIEIDHEYNNIPISIEMQSVDLNKALIEVSRSLRIANHAILINEGKKTAAIIVFPSINDAHAPMASLTRGNDGSDKARYGISATHLKQIKQNYYNRTLSPDDIVSPPSDDGSRPGMTRQELETIKENYQNRKKQMPGDTIVSPPSPEGKPGHSLAEVERIKREYRQNKSRY